MASDPIDDTCINDADDDWMQPVKLASLPAFAPRLPKPKKKKSSQDKSQDDTTSTIKAVAVTAKPDQKAWREDRNGDWDILQYGIADQRKVPLYKRDSIFLGFPTLLFSGYTVVNDKSRPGHYKLLSVNSHEFDEEFVTFKILPTTETIRIRNAPFAANSAFIPLQLGEAWFLDEKPLAPLREPPPSLRNSVESFLKESFDFEDFEAAERRLSCIYKFLESSKELTERHDPNRLLIKLHRERLSLLEHFAELPVLIAEWSLVTGGIEMELVENFLGVDITSSSSVKQTLLRVEGSLPAYIAFRMSEVHIFHAKDVIHLFAKCESIETLLPSFLMDVGLMGNALDMLSARSLPITTVLSIADDSEDYANLKLTPIQWFVRKEMEQDLAKPQEIPLPYNLNHGFKQSTGSLLHGSGRINFVLLGFGLPPLTNISAFTVPRFAPLAWSRVFEVPTRLEHAMTLLPGTPVMSLLEEGPLSTCWSLCCEPTGKTRFTRLLSPLSLITSYFKSNAQLDYVLANLEETHSSFATCTSIEGAAAWLLYFLLIASHRPQVHIKNELVREKLSKRPKYSQALLIAYARFAMLQYVYDLPGACLTDAKKALGVLWSSENQSLASRWLTELAIHEGIKNNGADWREEAVKYLAMFCLGIDFKQKDGFALTPALLLKASSQDSWHAALLDTLLNDRMATRDNLNPCDRLSILTIYGYTSNFDTRKDLIKLLTNEHDALPFACKLMLSMRLHRPLKTLTCLLEGSSCNPVETVFTVMLLFPSKPSIALNAFLRWLKPSKYRSPFAKCNFDPALLSFMWQWCLRFAWKHDLLNQPKTGSALIYGAVVSCPWCKDLYTLALEICEDTHLLGSQEDALQLLEMSEEKGIFWRTFLDQYKFYSPPNKTV